MFHRLSRDATYMLSQKSSHKQEVTTKYEIAPQQRRTNSYDLWLYIEKCFFKNCAQIEKKMKTQQFINSFKKCFHQVIQ